MKLEPEDLQRLKLEPMIFFKWVLFACGIGLLVGGVSTAFFKAFNFVTALRVEHPFLLYCLPAGGALIVLLYRVCGMEKDRGTNFVLMAVRENRPLPLRTAPLVFLSTLLTHLVGGSAGREGAILQIGGSISSSLGRLIHLDDKDSRIITMCGMSAAFSALFGTPLTAAVFSMEIVSVGIMYYAALVPCTLAAIIAVMVARFFHVPPTAYALPELPGLSFVQLGQVLLLGVLCAVLSVLFIIVMREVPKLYDRFLKNPVLRAAAGGALVIAMTLLCGSRDYNGAGGPVIAAAIAGSAKPEAFLLKILFTAVTLGAGFKGGEIVPAFFTGATFGCVMGPLLGLSPSLAAALGLVAVFCGVTNCPMTSLLLALELFGSEHILLFALVSAVSYMLSGYYSLYTEQKIVYSKLRPVFIDKKAR